MDPLDATTMRPPARPRPSDDESRTLVLTIAWHCDRRRIGESAQFDRTVKLSRLEPEFGSGAGAEPIADPNVSRRPIELTAKGKEVTLVVPEGGSQVEVDGLPVTSTRTLSETELHRGAVIAIAERVVVVLRRSSKKRGGGEAHGLIGHSAEIAWMVEQLERVAKSDANVLLRGATGTGKELVAQAIHRSSPRHDGSFIAVNMTTLPTTTATSQLFGHQKGAFTGASSDHRGLFAAADGGSIFLDEIGETPADVQAMLLRTLETGEVIPVGSTEKRSLDVRVIAATDADLERAVDEERFRSPLLHRLAGYQIELPALAQRREDIGPLLAHFLAAELHKVTSQAMAEREPTEPLWLSTSQLSRLIRHSWPGNVRQLRNLARRLAIGSGDTETVADSELDRHLEVRPEKVALAQAVAGTKRKPEDITDDELIAALRASQWKTSAAAVALGISRTSLYTLIERCDRVRKARDIEATEIEQVLGEAKGDTAAAASTLEVSERGLKLRMKELGISAGR